MNQPTPSLQAQHIRGLPHPQVSINAKIALQTRAVKRGKEDPYPELKYITPLTNNAIDAYVREIVDDIVEMIAVEGPISQKTALALIWHSIERIHYVNQGNGIQ
jgi:hypothetical protein